jgi:hypothetical protein
MVGQLQDEVAALRSQVEAMQLQYVQRNLAQGDFGYNHGNECQSRREMLAIPNLNIPVTSMDKDDAEEVEVPK